MVGVDRPSSVVEALEEGEEFRVELSVTSSWVSVVRLGTSVVCIRGRGLL